MCKPYTWLWGSEKKKKKLNYKQSLKNHGYPGKPFQFHLTAVIDAFLAKNKYAL